MSHSGNNPIPVGIAELKKALWKKNFRDLFPELEKQMKAYLNNPGCKCNQPLFNTLLQEKSRLEEYFGGPVKLLIKPITKKELASKTFVLNTEIDKLESELRRLPTGPKYISLARYEEKITAVIQLLT